MSRRRRLLTAIACALVLGAAATALVAAADPGGDASASKKAKGFTPAKLAGKWTGEWQNTTFKSVGEVRVNVQAKAGNKLLFLTDFAGQVFGCADPPAASVTVPKAKKGKNRWDASGFRFANKPTEAFGSMSITYNYKTKAFKGSGSGPACRPEVKYTIDGKLTPKRFDATVQIDLGGGESATATIAAAK